MGTTRLAAAPNWTGWPAWLVALAIAPGVAASACATPETPPPPSAASYQAATFRYTAGGETTDVLGAHVTPDFFESAWTTPALGRTFHDDDYTAEAGSRVVVSNAFWRESLDSDASAIGSSIVLDGRPALMVGVLAPGAAFPDGARLWVPQPSALRYQGAGRMALEGDNRSQPVTTMRVPAAFFDPANQPLLGRTFVDADLEPDAAGVAVISHRLWQSRFDGAPNVIGRRVALDGSNVLIIGVMPDGFDRTEGIDVWLLNQEASD